MEVEKIRRWQSDPDEIMVSQNLAAALAWRIEGFRVCRKISCRILLDYLAITMRCINLLQSDLAC